MLSHWYAYCLELGDDFLYVGISQFPAHRIFAHKNGEGSQLSKRHGVLDIVGVWDLGIIASDKAKMMEREITQNLTYIYDGKKVRGAGKCSEDTGYDGVAGNYVANFLNTTFAVKNEVMKMEQQGWS